MKYFKYIKTNRRERSIGGDPFSIKSGRYKDGQLDAVYRSGWSEDVYISDASEKDVVGKSFNFSQIYWVLTLAFIFMMLLLGKIAWLQVVKGDEYYAKAETNRTYIKRVEPKRGIIYDQKLRPLVRNQANFMLYVVPADLPREKEDLDFIINEIVNTVEGLDKEEILQKIEAVDLTTLESYQPIFIKDDIDYNKAMSLYLQAIDWPGVIMETKTRREYLNISEDHLLKNEIIGLSLSHILGYTGKINGTELENAGSEYNPLDYIGKMGVEYFWENELRGLNGKKQVEVDALGKEKKIVAQVDAEDGHNLVLSLDAEVQLKLEEIMKRRLDKMTASRASAVVLDPNNGEVVAMVSLPSYNNNSFARGISVDEYSTLLNHPDTPLLNRAISGTFPSGSTVKTVMSAAALQEGIITENTTFLSTGGIRIGEWYFPDWLAGGHGRVDVRRAIAESVNTFYYYIGGGFEDFKGLGVDKIVEYERMFGLGTQTGIDLAGEASGFLPTREWKELPVHWKKITRFFFFE
jgi:penicillin-binding protein 2